MGNQNEVTPLEARDMDWNLIASLQKHVVDVLPNVKILCKFMDDPEEVDTDDLDEWIEMEIERTPVKSTSGRVVFSCYVKNHSVANAPRRAIRLRDELIDAVNVPSFPLHDFHEAPVLIEDAWGALLLEEKPIKRGRFGKAAMVSAVFDLVCWQKYG